MRLIAVDTETTGLNYKGNVCKDHRIIEIACVEIVHGVITGKEFHAFVNPQMKISAKAKNIHGTSDEFLKDKPLFKDIVKPFLDFIGGDTVIIHNAPFDIAFLNKEFSILKEKDKPTQTFNYVDTLAIARSIFPGEDNTLDALCNKFGLTDKKKRDCHSALEDARMLAELYLKVFI